MRRRRFLQVILGLMAAACGVADRDRVDSGLASPSVVDPSPSPRRAPARRTEPGDPPSSRSASPGAETRSDASAVDDQAAPGPDDPSTVAVGTVAVICREAIGLPPPRPDDRSHRIEGMMVHHTAAPTAPASRAPDRFRSHTAFHRDQGWPDIAYHLGVDVDGNVYELRPMELPGDTFTDYDPAGWLLIVCEGDFDESAPADVMLDAVARLLAWGHGRFGAAIDDVAGHRDHAATSCPGDRLYTALPDVRASAHDYVRRGGVAMEVLCGQEAAEYVAAIERGDT